MGQISLFAKKEDIKKDFEDGEIVAQKRAWIGSYNTIFPLLQVRYSKIHDGDDERKYYCYPIPYGVFPLTGYWYKKEDIKTTGLKWRVPTQDEIDKWCEKHPYDVSTSNSFLRGLNSSRRNDEGEWYCQLYEPFPEEKELVELIEKLDVDYRNITRDNFKEKMREIKC